MALVTPPFGLHNAGQGGSDQHSAQSARQILAVAVSDTPGIVSGFAVTESSPVGMSVDVGVGLCVVPVTSAAGNGAWPLRNVSADTLTVEASNPTDPRIDIVVVRVKDSDLDGTTPGPTTDVAALEVVAGTPAPAPVAPATPDNSLLIATIDVGANVSTIVNADITVNDVELAPLPVRRTHELESPAATGQIGGLHWDQVKRRLLAETASGLKIVGGEMPEVSRTRDAQSTGTGVQAQILFASANPITIVDTDGIITTHTMTIPAGLGGDWEIGMRGWFSPHATGHRYVNIDIGSNAVTGEAGLIRNVVPAIASTDIYTFVTKMVRLKAGATLTPETFQDSGGSLAFNAPHMWARMVNHLPGF